MTDTQYSASLESLLDAITDITTEVQNSGDVSREITGVTADSRRVVPGSMFVAVRGVDVDGHRFIPQALERGASAIVIAAGIPMPPIGEPATVPPTDTPAITVITVADTRQALGLLASRFYGDPSENLTLIGVTGTNGKTTIATLLYEIARMHGMKAGLISTVANIVDTDSVPAEHTTPDPVMLNGLLRQMVDAGCSFAAMEVSSHAADQHRIAGLTFAGGIFTNLTRDHLDYHKTFENYLRAKQSFFDMLPAEAFALTNADDRNGMVMVQNTRARKYTYSTRGLADFTARIVEERIDGMLIDFNGTEVETQFTGRFNAANLGAVYGAGTLLGLPKDRLDMYMSRLIPVAGRFQPIRSRYGVTAIVDYAHTPDALVNVLDTINEIRPDTARVITVCGAGGNRDKGKRPQMAAAAALRSDTLILTSDNPRHEDPRDILDDMLAGLNADQRDRTKVFIDRRDAIAYAVAIAVPGDIILLAGKGHETSQVIGDIDYHFDDREEVAAAFEAHRQKLELDENN